MNPPAHVVKLCDLVREKPAGSPTISNAHQKRNKKERKKEKKKEA